MLLLRQHGLMIGAVGTCAAGRCRRGVLQCDLLIMKQMCQHTRLLTRYCFADPGIIIV